MGGEDSHPHIQTLLLSFFFLIKKRRKIILIDNPPCIDIIVMRICVSFLFLSDSLYPFIFLKLMHARYKVCYEVLSINVI